MGGRGTPTGPLFVCHSTTDGPQAARVVAALEAAGHRCWIAPRDVAIGVEYTEAVIDALEAAGAVVLLLSAMADRSPHVRRELELAVNLDLPLFPVRLDSAPPGRSVRYAVGATQWLDASGSDEADWLPRLAQVVARRRPRSSPGPVAEAWVLVDTSYSMVQDHRLTEAASMLDRLASVLATTVGSQISLGVITFSNRAAVVRPAAGPASWRPLALRADGATSQAAAFRALVSAVGAAPPTPRLVAMVTDGQPTDSTEAWLAAAEAAAPHVDRFVALALDRADVDQLGTVGRRLVDASLIYRARHAGEGLSAFGPVLGHLIGGWVEELEGGPPAAGHAPGAPALEIVG